MRATLTMPLCDIEKIAKLARGRVALSRERQYPVAEIILEAEDGSELTLTIYVAKQPREHCH